jgi:F420H(2)-dependent quinone reductase
VSRVPTGAKTRRPVLNATVCTLLRLGLMRRSTALLETTGRAGYVRNIEANPRVWLRAGRRWRTGTARFIDDVPPEQALRLMVEHNPATRRNAGVVRDIHSQMRVIRVDLDPA